MGKISAWYDNEWGFQTGCVILWNTFIKFLNEIYKDQENLEGKIVLLRLDLNVPLKNEYYR